MTTPLTTAATAAARTAGPDGRRGTAGAGVDWAVVNELRVVVAQRLETERARLGRGGQPLGSADERALAVSLVAAAIETWTTGQTTAGQAVLGYEAERALAEAVTASLFGLGRLEPLLDREDVENIHIHGADRVVLQLADGTWETGPPVADSDAELVELLTGWAARAGQTGREFSPARPILNLRIPAGGPLGARVAAVMEVTERPTVAIRRHRLPRATLAELAGLGAISPFLHAFLSAAVRAGCNLVVSGAPAVGKTTMLRALAAETDPFEHLVTVEEEYELGLHLLDQPDHPTTLGRDLFAGPAVARTSLMAADLPALPGTGSAAVGLAGGRLVTAMETRQANAEGVGGIGLHALLTQALRHSPTRVLVGEVRGGEVTALLSALANGAAGGMCTLHAMSAVGVLSRIAQLGQLSDPPLAPEAAWRFCAEALDLIVHLRRDDTGRYVSEVVEVGQVGDGGLPDTTTILAPGPDGRAMPAHTPSDRLRRRLAGAGFTGITHATGGPAAGSPVRPAVAVTS
jgi:pilus assembly protein CpaF